MIWLVPFIGAISNCFLRGGGLESYIGKIGGLRYLNAIIFGLCAFWANHQIYFSLEMTSAMALGQLFAIPHNETIKGNIWPMFFRGIIWCTPIIIILAINKHNPIIYLPISLCMYLVYRSCDLYFETHKPYKLLDQVKLSEYIYGFLLFLPIVFLQH